MHGLAVYVKERPHFAQDFSLENYADSYLYFTSFGVLLLFLYQQASLSQWNVFDAISSNIDEVLSITQSADVFVFETLTSIIRTGKTILVELIDLLNTVIIFLSQTTSLRLLRFLLVSLTVTLIVLLFQISFFLPSYQFYIGFIQFPMTSF